MKNNPNYEVRSLTRDVNMIERDGKRFITGYAAVFNSPSQIMTTDKGKKFREVIAPGAFRKSLVDADVRALFNHDSNELLGRRQAGTLRLIEDDIGLLYEIDPNLNTTTGRNVVAHLERQDLTGSSFSFAAIDDQWSSDAEGIAVRELRQAHLFDVGPVVFPAYLEASAAYRSLDKHLSRSIEIEIGPDDDEEGEALESEPEPESEPASDSQRPAPELVIMIHRLNLILLS